MIEAQAITKQFGDHPAVSDLSFRAEPGRILGLLGPNGAGKTTTIRMIMNILAPDSGAISINGHRLREEDKAIIGYLPEERGLYQKVSVVEMLTYLGELKGKSRKDLQVSIDSWLERFDLLEWKDKPINELSKGMSQKVQFIASINHDPSVILFDEPFAGLDPVSADVLTETIMELGNQGKTILFSTHITEHAERICSDILLMHKGKKIESGSLREIKSKYAGNTVILEFDGNGGFIETLPMVEQIVSYPRRVEVRLKPSAGPDELLKAVVGRITIQRFEVSAPSLHSIFVERTGVERTGLERTGSESP
ncbi:MAG: ATP-binding cassette domain-containing protein [Spirochaetales bacterium]|nr:ATP-binding cassette domain-containing protein [Spirochaetales bacterium]MCF7938245.1 ATP-binding cassette domain-containing protein [Spirochaetales bacterium]